MMILKIDNNLLLNYKLINLEMIQIQLLILKSNQIILIIKIEIVKIIDLNLMIYFSLQKINLTFIENNEKKISIFQ